MSERLEKIALVIGFIPLTDCASIVVAHELGFFARHGLDVTLSREGSWASIRDKVAYGLLDAAHMLAPMPLASTLGVGGPKLPMVTAVSLGVNGNGITVSAALYEAMRAAALDGAPDVRDLQTVIAADRLDGRAPLTFGIVFPTSMHNYLLRYWLASAGIDPDHDVNLVVVPPPQMASRLQLGHIDGFCVGEPWNTAAEATGAAKLLIAGHKLWRDAPEKVLGVTLEWADKHPHTHRALVRAVIEASRWLNEAPDHREQAAQWLSEARYIGIETQLIRQSLLDQSSHVFFRDHASFPWRSHALWLLTQMLRWGQVRQAFELRTVAEAVYRSDVYRDAASQLGVTAPASDYKAEPAERFYDGRAFNPDEALQYLGGQDITRLSVPPDVLAAANG